MRTSGISQENFAALIAKTDMRRVEALVKEQGHKKWREYVQKNAGKLAKDSSSTGITTGLGLNFIDLRAPAYMLDPIFTPIRNSTPRWDKVNAGYGVQPQWKAITSIDQNNQFPGVSEGNTNSYGSFQELDYSAPYVTLGTDDFVTYESISASEGYEDALGDGKMWQLLRFIRQQERSYIGGAGTTASRGALQIGTSRYSSRSAFRAEQRNLRYRSSSGRELCSCLCSGFELPRRSESEQHREQGNCDSVPAFKRGWIDRRHQRRHSHRQRGLERRWTDHHRNEDNSVLLHASSRRVGLCVVCRDQHRRVLHSGKSFCTALGFHFSIDVQLLRPNPGNANRSLCGCRRLCRFRNRPLDECVGHGRPVDHRFEFDVHDRAADL